MNHNKKILTSTRLSAQVEKIAPKDSFHASKRGEFIKETCQRDFNHWFSHERVPPYPLTVKLTLQEFDQKI
jgi:hypothetical protein